jgi:hypothetical protein
MVLAHLRLDHLTTKLLDPSERALLVLAHQAGEAYDISREDRCETAGGHSGTPAIRSPLMKRSLNLGLTTKFP